MTVNGTLDLSVQTTIEQGKYHMLLTNLDGRTIFDQTLDHSEGLISQIIQLPSTISSGIYLLTVRDKKVKIFKQFLVR